MTIQIKFYERRLPQKGLAFTPFGRTVPIRVKCSHKMVQCCRTVTPDPRHYLMVDIMLDFGKRISELRKQNHMTQQVLSERLCVTKATVSSYETGVRLPSLDVLIKMAYVFHVSTDYLLGICEKSQLSVDGLTEHQIEIVTMLISEFKEK